jgi:hypothetical protein
MVSKLRTSHSKEWKICKQSEKNLNIILTPNSLMNSLAKLRKLSHLTLEAFDFTTYIMITDSGVCHLTNLCQDLKYIDFGCIRVLSLYCLTRKYSKSLSGIQSKHFHFLEISVKILKFVERFDRIWFIYQLIKSKLI